MCYMTVEMRLQRTSARVCALFAPWLHPLYRASALSLASDGLASRFHTQKERWRESESERASRLQAAAMVVLYCIVAVAVGNGRKTHANFQCRTKQHSTHLFVAYKPQRNGIWRASIVNASVSARAVWLMELALWQIITQTTANHKTLIFCCDRSNLNIIIGPNKQGH